MSMQNETLTKIELLQANARQSKSAIKSVIDEIIKHLQNRKKQLLKEVDTLTKQKTDALIKLRDDILRLSFCGNQQRAHVDCSDMVHFADRKSVHQNTSDQITHSVPPDTLTDIDEILSPASDPLTKTDFHIEVNLDGLDNILKTVRNWWAQNEESKYIKRIRHGMEAEKLLFAGYIRSVKELVRVSGNKDVENLCFTYYYWNDINADNDLHSTKLCSEIQNVLRGKVEEVFVDELNHRDNDVPFRIVDHSIKQSLPRESSKISIAINPSNLIMKTMCDRIHTDFQYEKTMKYVVNLLYGTQLASCNLSLSDAPNWCEDVHKLIKLGLEIYDTDCDESTDCDDSEVSDNSTSSD
eukprot:194447_1